MQKGAKDSRGHHIVDFGLRNADLVFKALEMGSNI